MLEEKKNVPLYQKLFHSHPKETFSQLPQKVPQYVCGLVNQHHYDQDYSKVHHIYNAPPKLEPTM